MTTHTGVPARCSLRLPRRSLLGLSILALTPRSIRAQSAPSPDPDRSFRREWAGFRARFMTPDGRITDTFQGGASHSEGQGYGLLLAEAAGDRDGFDVILRWTRENLRRPADNLHPWRWRPTSGAPIEDPNNATDGDLLIAWALARAAESMQRPDYARLSGAIARDILRLCVHQVGDRTLLRPGGWGFDRADHTVVNLSYLLFAAFVALNATAPDPAWARLTRDGRNLLSLARFGPWGLPPDWLRVPRGIGRASPAAGWPARFGYDAVRVPLNLVWAGYWDDPALDAAAAFWADPAVPAPPAWTDLSSGHIAPYAASAGVRAVARITVAARIGGGRHLSLPAVSEAPDYYAAVLILLARLAWRDAPQSGPRQMAALG